MTLRVRLLSLTLLVLLGCTAKESLESPETDIDKDAIYRNALLWVFKPSINIRDSASSSAKKLGSLVDGDSVVVLQNVDGWYQIRTVDGQLGWIRSDLLGPKALSAFNSAVSFVENLREKENIDLYFDKKFYHKRIYLSYPTNAYSSPQNIEKKTRQLVENFQHKVYRGPVTARVLQPGSENEFLTLEIEGAINADPILPVIPFGRIESVDRNNPSGIKLYYSIPKDISDDELITTARQIVPKFPISYQHVELIFKDSPYSAEKPCRLWYREDKNGENYQIGACK